MATDPIKSTSETAGKAVLEIKFEVAHFYHKNLVLRVNQLNDR